MISTRYKIGLRCLSAVCLGAMVLTSCSSDQEPSTSQKPEEMKPAQKPSIDVSQYKDQPFPDKTYYRLVDGEIQSTLVSPVGKSNFLIVYYSASFCGPCKIVTPALVDLYHRFKPEHPEMEILMINNDIGLDDMIEYMEDTNVPFPVINIESDFSLNRFSMENMLPHLLVIDQNEELVLGSFSMSRGPTAMKLIAMIEERLNPESDAVSATSL